MTLLEMGPAEVDARATQQLRGMKLYARNQGDLTSAVVSAAYYAKKRGKTMYVFLGNSYGHAVYLVRDKRDDYLHPINNTGLRLLSVTPDLVVARHAVSR